jgi:hypothetical protein
MRNILLSMTIVGVAGLASAAPFQPGNLVVLRVGDGTNPLINTGNAVFIEEVSISTGAGVIVQTLTAPTLLTGNQRQCLVSGTATSEGQLLLSGDGSRVHFGCYGRDLGGTGSLASSASATVPRVAAQVLWDGTIDSSTALGDAHTGNNIRTVISFNGAEIYTAGGNEGLRISAFGSTTSQLISNATATGTSTNLRTLGIAAGQLFVSTAQGTNPRLLQIGTGLPNTAGTLMAGVPGMPIDRSFYGFQFLDVSPTVPGLDVLYVADDSAVAPGPGVLKYSLVEGNWVSNGRFAMNGARGLVAGQTVFGLGVAVVADANCADGSTATPATTPLLRRKTVPELRCSLRPRLPPTAASHSHRSLSRTCFATVSSEACLFGHVRRSNLVVGHPGRLREEHQSAEILVRSGIQCLDSMSMAHEPRGVAVVQREPFPVPAQRFSEAIRNRPGRYLQPRFSISQRALACSLSPQQIFLGCPDTQVCAPSEESTVNSKPCAIIALSNGNSGFNSVTELQKRTLKARSRIALALLRTEVPRVSV